MPSRRDFLKTTGGLALGTGGTWLAAKAHGAVPGPPGFAPLPAGTVASGELEAIAGKVPLIKRTWRPPNYETPLSYFAEEFTPRPIGQARRRRWNSFPTPPATTTTWCSGSPSTPSRVP